MVVDALELVIQNVLGSYLSVKCAHILQEPLSLVIVQLTIVVNVRVVKNFLSRFFPLCAIHLRERLADQHVLFLIRGSLLEPVPLQGGGLSLLETRKASLRQG